MTLADRIDTASRRAMLGMDIPWLVDQWAQRSPDAPFMIWAPFEGDGRTWSHAELQADARRIAGALHARGVRAGDFVIIHLDNSPEFVLAWYACAELGAVAVSTNTRSVAPDMRYFAEHTAAVCAITQPAYARMVVEACPGLEFVVVTDNDGGAPADVGGLDAEAFAELLTGTTEAPRRQVDPFAKLSVQFTSGTTSRPKAVLWSHANGVWAGRASAIHTRLRRDDRTLIFLPLFHTNAQAWSMLATHWSGGSFVLQPRFSASRFWRESVEHRCTWLSTIPFAFKAVMSQPVPEHHYRFWGTAAHLPKVGSHFGVDIIGWWGMTETLTQGIVTDVDHPGPEGTIGRPSPAYAVEVRRPDGTLADADERGALWIRGTRGVSLFEEYYGNPEATAKAFDARGFFATGDMVRRDAAGNLYFSDREKDMLKVGAENVAASEIERVILETGWIAEAAVVGQRHPMLDEVPVAFVIPAPGAPENVAEAVLEHCRANLADFKVPRAVHTVDALPRSTLEKVAKNELRGRLPPIEQA